MKILVTGGAGFIGSNFVRYFLEQNLSVSIINLDKLTYAGNLESLGDLEANPRHRFVRGDITDPVLVNSLAQEVEAIIHFAAETHVDRSIVNADEFIRTNVYGTYILLEASRKYCHHRFVHVSTDEVYGSRLEGFFKEEDPLSPTSPYSASKASSDLLVSSYYKTYGLPTLITRCSNNFGPYQFPEKLIPLMITNALEDRPLPIYGDGFYVRDWLYVLDHCEAIDRVFHHGLPGETYNIGGQGDKKNIEVVHFILDVLKKPKSLIQYVKDRPGHDRRYAIDPGKLENELGWKPAHLFDKSLEETIHWYVTRTDWWKRVKSGEYLKMYEKIYGVSL
ncbi:MAG: dTDP-glucose 4,6-dehydratase [Nitrospirae bacterium]|nr:dTDP-glucose 4,6-dehydratase [Candidatus Manganitrophaceae bacterium]